MRDRSGLRIGLATAALAVTGAMPASAQWFARPYPYYYPAPAYPYYRPPPVYQPVYPPVYRPVYPQTYVPAPAPVRPSESVVDVQHDLAQLGYDAGPADGLYGPRLADAVQAFQRDHQQPVNGRLTGETIGAIHEAARSRDTQSVPQPAAEAAPLASDIAPPPPPTGPRPTLSVRPAPSQ